MKPLAVIVLMIVAADTAAKTESGRACIAGKQCFPAKRVFVVEASDQERVFAWAPEAEAEVVFGTIARGTANVNVDTPATPLRTALLSIVPPADDPAVTIDLIVGENARWSWRSHSAGAIRTLQIPKTVTAIVFSAPRHRPVRFSIKPADSDRVAVGRIALQRYETLSGRVVQADSGNPVALATVETDNGTVLGEIAPDGNFEIDIDSDVTDRWPTALHVKAPGFGTKILPLAPVPQPRRWDRIELSRGGALNVRVTGSTDDRSKEVVLELRRHRGETPDAWETVRRSVATVGGAPSMFNDLDGGKYVLIAAGRGPLEQIATDVEIEPAQTVDLNFDVVPVLLRFVVRHAGSPVPRAEIDVRFENRWNASISITDSVLETHLWQRGEFMAFVVVSGRGTFTSRRTIEGDSDVAWVVDIPDRAIAGTVRDRSTRRPLEGAVVALQNSGSLQSARTDHTGAYRSDFLTAGQYTVRVIETQGLLGAASDLVLGENDRVRKIDFDLAAAKLVRLRVVDTTGQPAARAKVFDSTQPDVQLQTDSNGEVVLRLSEDETRRLIIVPWRGAFVAANVSASSNDASPVTIHAQPGPATLTISAKDQAGQAISGLWYDLRYNGEQLPEDVLLWIAARDGNQIPTGADGLSILSGMPLGVYELWPATSQRSPGTSLGRAPVRFTAQPGENPVELTFARW